MKRFVCLLLALCLPLTASAESLKTTLGVPDRVDCYFVTNTGKTTIHVNADVSIPTVDSVSVYDYAPTRVTEEQALAMAQALGLEEISAVRYEPMTSFGTIYADYTREYFNASDMVHTDSSKWVFSVEVNQWHGKPFGGEIYYRLQDRKIDYYTRNDIYPYGTMPETCRFSREEARRMAFELAAQVAPDYTLVQEGITAGQQRFIGDTAEEIWTNWDEDLRIPNGFGYVFTRLIDSIPMTVAKPLVNPYDSSLDLDFVGGEYMPALADEGLKLVIADDGFEEVVLTNPFAVGEPIEKNLADLIPFETILEIAKNVLPLKMLTFEVSEYQQAFRVEIDRITFGYARVLKQGSPREFILVPVWDFFGNRLAAQKVDGAYEDVMTNDANTSYLTIDARTGLVVDREYGY